MNLQKQNWLIFTLLAIIVYFPFFLPLDSLSLRLWDESRRGVNALEMAQTGNLLIPTFEGRPDMYGTKPPLLVWTQAFFINILGPGELAVRLPSALAAMATVVLLFVFCWKDLNKPLAGAFSGLVLATSPGYIGAHGAVAGDYDALLLLWTAWYSILFYRYTLQPTHKRLYSIALLVILAGLTKGVAGMFFAPALIIFALTQKKLAGLIRNVHTWYAAALAVAGVGCYYIIREWYNPGYIAMAFGNEISGRYFEAREGHNYGPWFYFYIIWRDRMFFPWLFLLPFSIWFVLGSKQLKPVGLFALLNISTVFLIVSTSATKLPWYWLPALPMLCLLVGLFIDKIIHWVYDQLKAFPAPIRLGLSLFLLLAIFYFPYRTIIKKVYISNHQGWQEEQMVYRDFIKVLPKEDSITILHPYYNGHITFYKSLANKTAAHIGQHILFPPPEKVQVVSSGTPLFNPGEWIGVCEQQAMDTLSSRFQYEVLKELGPCRLVEIKGVLVEGGGR